MKTFLFIAIPLFFSTIGNAQQLLYKQKANSSLISIRKAQKILKPKRNATLIFELVVDKKLAGSRLTFESSSQNAVALKVARKKSQFEPRHNAYIVASKGEKILIRARIDSSRSASEKYRIRALSQEGIHSVSFSMKKSPDFQLLGQNVSNPSEKSSLTCTCHGGPGGYPFQCAPIRKMCQGGPGYYSYPCLKCP